MKRRTFWIVAGSAAIVVAVAVAGLLSWYLKWQGENERAWEERRGELAKVVESAQPIIGALESYRAERGRYPRQLDRLVPAHLAYLPKPPAFAVRGWEYSVEPACENNGCSADELRYDLWISLSPEFCLVCKGWLRFYDAFVYHPNDVYPKEAHGGVLERVGGWGYYHE